MTACHHAPPQTLSPEEAASDLAQVDALARSEPQRMACAIVSLPPAIGLVPGTPGSGHRSTPRGPNRLAQSVQHSMSQSEAMSVALHSGLSPSRAERLVKRNLARSQSKEAKAQGIGDDRWLKSSDEELDDAQLLRRYATLWAERVTETDANPETAARLEEIEDQAPWMSGIYTHALLYAYQNWDFGC